MMITHTEVMMTMMTRLMHTMTVVMIPVLLTVTQLHHEDLTSINSYYAQCPSSCLGRLGSWARVAQ